MVNLQEIIHIENVKDLFKQYSLMTRMSIGLIDIAKHEFIIAIEYATLCEKYHRVNSQTYSYCLDKDAAFLKKTFSSKEIEINYCKHGLVNGCVPVFLHDVHIATITTGQIFLEEPDLEKFTKQAQLYGFDLDGYIQAVKNVPVIEKKTFLKSLGFLQSLAELLAQMGLKTINLAKKDEEIIRQKDFLQQILDAVPLPMFYKNKDFIYQGVNTAFEELFNENRQTLIGKTVYETHPKKYADIYNNKDNELFLNPPKQQYETKLQTKSGQVHDVIINKRIYYTQEGEPAGIVGTFFDITDKKLVENKLFELKNKLSALINGIPDLIWFKDLDGKFITVNQALATFIGTSIEDMIGKTDYDFMQPSYAQIFLEEDHQVLKSRKKLTIINHFPKGMDDYVAFETTKFILSDSFGEPIGIAGIARNITHRLKLEEELKSERANLEIKVKERTNELILSLKKLEEANFHKSKFLSSLSHELRTPLNAIIGFTDLLSKEYYGALNEKQKEYISLVISSAQHLLSLISDLLDIAKIDAGALELNIEEFNLYEFLKDISNTINPEIYQKIFDFNINYPNSDILLNTDKTRLRQIIFNLINNAIKFIPDHCGQISLTAELSEDNMVRFSVQDNGIGISKENQERIFEEFFQVQASNNMYQDGTGIGLSLVKRLVEIQGGKIGLSSTPEKGSIFWFTVRAK